MPNPVEVLTKAREHLVKYGWRQYRRGELPVAYPGSGWPCCAAQAVNEVEFDLGPSSQDPRKLLREALPAGWSYIGDFNDAPGRTFSEILALYDRAIELAKREAADG